LAIVLTAILISGRPLRLVRATESSDTLDASFGTGGKVTTDFAGLDDGANSVAVQLNGKIVAAGDASTGDGSDFALARYNRDGTLDASFGTGGKVTTDFADSDDFATSVTILLTGKIVAAGSAFTGAVSDFALARYNGDGTLDASFGTGGKVTTDFAGSDDFANSVAVQLNGKIVVAGNTSAGTGSDFALARYNSDGTLDTSFGTGGKVTTDFAGLDDRANSVALQLNGKIIVAGFAGTGDSSDFALAHYNSNGTLNASFGTGGKVTTDFASSDDFANSVAMQLNGKIVVAGNTFTATGNDFALARYNRDGTLDASFGTGGKVTTGFAGFESVANSIAVQLNGKIVAAGYSGFGSTGSDFALARYE
jgi:uncharacterized delta-60 repeat protein